MFSKVLEILSTPIFKLLTLLFKLSMSSSCIPNDFINPIILGNEVKDSYLINSGKELFITST